VPISTSVPIAGGEAGGTTTLLFKSSISIPFDRRTGKVSAHRFAVVALLAEVPGEGLARGGQVGTVVEQLDDKVLLVEFSDDQGRAYAVAPCPRSELLVLRYLPMAA
jgi:hypothetical protein